MIANNWLHTRNLMVMCFFLYVMFLRYFNNPQICFSHKICPNCNSITLHQKHDPQIVRKLLYQPQLDINMSILDWLEPHSQEIISSPNRKMVYRFILVTKMTFYIWMAAVLSNWYLVLVKKNPLNMGIRGETPQGWKGTVEENSETDEETERGS